MQKLRIPKDHPRKLRMPAEELKLKAGRLVNEADSDFATLQQLRAPSPATPSSTGKHPIMDGYNQLSQDLQSGNISAAQQDYTNIRQAYQNLAAHVITHRLVAKAEWRNS